MPATLDERDLRERLNLIAQRHSRAEIARKTAVAPNNVSRYLNDTRIPADFVSRVVATFGVNPVWMLTGNGAPWLAEVTGDAVKLAGNILELVQAMNEVVQMRLGALSGKHHLRVLRELNDALVHYEGLRQKLNTHSVPIFSRLLDDLQRALQTYDIDRATDLRKAARQVERLCDEPALSRRFTALQAHIEALNLNGAEVMRLQQKLVREPLSEGRLAGDEQCEEFLRLSLTLADNGRPRDALRVCNAFKELADAAADHWAGMPDLRFQRASLLVEMGRLREGLAEMQRWTNLVSERRRGPTRAILARALMLAGLLDLPEAFTVGPNTELKVQYLIEVACWREDAALLQRALTTAREAVLPGFLPQIEVGECLLAALTKHDRKSAARLKKAIREQGKADQDTFQVNLVCAQLALAARDRKTALLHHDQAAIQLAEPTVAENAPVMLRAIHARNAVRLERDAATACAALNELVEAGYELFRR